AVLRKTEAGALQLDDQLPIEDADALEAEPEGGVAPGETPTIREALAAMLSISSNAAAHAFLRTLGRHEFNLSLAQLGLNQTRVPELTGSDDDLSPTEAVTSAADMAHLLRVIASGQDLSSTTHNELLGLLAAGGEP